MRKARLTGDSGLLAGLLANATLAALGGDESALAWFVGEIQDCPLPYAAVADHLDFPRDWLPLGVAEMIGGMTDV